MKIAFFVVMSCVDALVFPTSSVERRAALVGGFASGFALLDNKAIAAPGPISVDFAPDVNGVMTSSASFVVPEDWKKLSDTTAAVSGGRRLVVYASPTDNDFNCFLLLTPIRGDYTSLGSFGTLDSVQDTVIPRGEGIDSQLIKSSSSTGKYTYEYTLGVPDQPKRRLKTVFSLMSDTIVSFTVQSLEENYTPSVGTTSDGIISTFALNKRAA